MVWSGVFALLTPVINLKAMLHYLSGQWKNKIRHCHENTRFRNHFQRDMLGPTSIEGHGTTI